MDLLGGLNPTIYNQAQTSNLTRQQQEQAQQLQNILQNEGQNKQNQKFTSPWQVAGQFAQAIAAKNLQNQINPNYSTLNSQQPYGNGGGAPTDNSQPSAPASQPPAQPAPGQGLPWSGGATKVGDMTDFTSMPQMTALDLSSMNFGTG